MRHCVTHHKGFTLLQGPPGTGIREEEAEEEGDQEEAEEVAEEEEEATAAEERSKCYHCGRVLPVERLKTVDIDGDGGWEVLAGFDRGYIYYWKQ